MRLKLFARLPRPWRWVARIVSVLLVLALVFAGAAVWAVQRSFPQVDGTLTVKGLTGKVTIYRDKFGIPHIYADTSEDLFMAQGYVHAQDRFWEMDFRRHVTAGRLSELFGKATLTEDKVIRTMGWRRVAEKELPMLSESTRRYLDAYAKGVNAWLADNGGATERGLEYAVLMATVPDYEPAVWTAVDSLAWLKAMAWDLRSNVEDEVERATAAAGLSKERVEALWPDYPYDRHAPIVTRGGISGGGFDQNTEARDVEGRDKDREGTKARDMRGSRESGEGGTRDARAGQVSPDTAVAGGARPGAPYGGATAPRAAADGEASKVERPAPEPAGEKAQPSPATAEPSDDAGAQTTTEEATPSPEEAQTGAALARVAAAMRSVPDLIGRGEREGLGSNSWVVSGRHTASGKPLLANDPHLGASMPSVWYQVGLHCRTRSGACPFDVTGFSFAGLPGVMIGQNDRIAWGFTNLAPDVADLYLEKVRDDTYLYRGQWRPLTTREEEIKVAGGDAVKVTVRETGNGPIMSEVHRATGRAQDGGGKAAGETADAVSMRWTALQPGTSADAIFTLNAARDWAEFRTAASQFAVPSQNLIYADIEGNIGYQAPGVIPVRAKGDGRWPVPGWTGEYEWTGTIPFGDLPSVFNPPEGYIVTANNAVIDPAKYPPLLTKDWSYGYRSQRILDRLKGSVKTGKIDAAEMSRIQQDSANGMAAVLRPELMKIPLAGPSQEARELLRTWDFSQDADSAPAAYFNAVWRHLLVETFNDDLPEGARPEGGSRWFEVVRRMLAEPADPFWDDSRTPIVERRDDILRRSLALAYGELRERLGDNPKRWRWSDLHTLTLVNESLGKSGIAPVEWLFNRGPIAAPGSRDAVNAVSWDVQEGYEVTAVPSMRMVVDLADADKSRWINLTGASGHAFHDNYWDQAPLWANGETTPMLAREESIRAAATHTLTLSPG
ncbi:penicillin acylase family protein [Sinosporangium siamense]|uniref:Penicillin amidase n=1 Tax=Sinosporangium siamense TaxID=1367973 RepID=A0A919V8D8_9ACTN|nr:penicillin acylase family protein [Sinosporangium siamense]GII93122.1 hypothetical protein Ssi02_33530 [Sinosporangium siamense]